MWMSCLDRNGELWITHTHTFLAKTGPNMFLFGRVPNFGEWWGQVLEGISRLLRAWVWREDLLLQTKLCAHFRWMHSHFKQLRYTDAKLLVVYKGPLLVQRVHAQHVLWWHFGSRQQPQVPALGESEGLVLQFSNTFPHFKEVHREVPSGIPWCHGTLWPGGALKHTETSDHSDLPGGVSLYGFGILSTRGLIINQIFSPISFIFRLRTGTSYHNVLVTTPQIPSNSGSEFFPSLWWVCGTMNFPQ